MNIHMNPLNPFYLKIGAVAVPAVVAAALAARNFKNKRDASKMECYRDTNWDIERSSLELTVTGYEIKDSVGQGSVALNLKKYAESRRSKFGLIEVHKDSLLHKYSDGTKELIGKIDSKTSSMIEKLEAFSGPEVNSHSQHDEKLLAVNLGFSMLRIYDSVAAGLINGENIPYRDKAAELDLVFEDLQKIGLFIKLSINRRYHALVKEKMLIDSESKNAKKFLR